MNKNFNSVAALLSPFILLSLMANAKASAGWLNGFRLTGQSGKVHVNEGYASNGTSNHYFFGVRALYLSSSFDSLNVVAKNEDVLVPGTNHMGAGDYYSGLVYSVIEDYQGCDKPPSKGVIRLFDASSLLSVRIQDITQDLHEVSGLAIIPDSDEAVVSSFCDNTQLFVYGLTDLSLKRKIPLVTPVTNIQGVAYRDGFLYIADTHGGLYGLQLLDNSMKKLYQAPYLGEYEGLDFHSDQLRWLVNLPLSNNVLLYLSPK